MTQERSPESQAIIGNLFQMSHALGFTLDHVQKHSTESKNHALSSVRISIARALANFMESASSCVDMDPVDSRDKTL